MNALLAYVDYKMYIKKLLYILLFIGFSLQIALAQPALVWSKLYNQYNLGAGASAMASDTSGYIYITGSVRTASQNDNIITLKYSSSGDLQWAAEYNGPGSNSIDAGYGIALDKSGNVYVTGRSEETGFLTDAFCTIKYDSNGEQKWVQRYLGPGDVRDEVYTIVLDDSANVYISGSGTGSVSGRDSATTIKYNTNGVRQWVKRYPGRSSYLCSDAQGNVFITGNFTAKYNSNGVMQWISRLDSIGSPGARKIKLDQLGNVYIIGQAGTGSNADYLTVKYNSNGSVQWTAQYNGPGNNDDYNFDLAIDNIGNVYTTGVSGRAGSGSDYATIKYNLNGIQQWVQRYNGPGNSGANGIALDSLANVYITGRNIGNNGTDCTTVIYNTNGIQQYVLRYDDSANNDAGGISVYVDRLYNIYVLGGKYYINNNILLIKYSPIVKVNPISENIPGDYKLFQNYPNPFNPETVIQYRIAKAGFVSLKIYDVLGRLVETIMNEKKSAGHYTNTWSAVKYPSGIYFYKLAVGDITGSSFVDTKKMVLLK